MEKRTIYHGSSQIVKNPEIRITRFYKDFGFGFYWTLLEKQAIRWAKRYEKGFVNVYEYTLDASLKTLTFECMDEKWLDFIIQCRNGQTHSYDIVEGPWRMIRFSTTFNSL